MTSIMIISTDNEWIHFYFIVIIEWTNLLRVELYILLCILSQPKGKNELNGRLET